MASFRDIVVFSDDVIAVQSATESYPVLVVAAWYWAMVQSLSPDSKIKNEGRSPTIARI
jgi:hypothetical protein